MLYTMGQMSFHVAHRFFDKVRLDTMKRVMRRLWEHTRFRWDEWEAEREAEEAKIEKVEELMERLMRYSTKAMDSEFAVCFWTIDQRRYKPTRNRKRDHEWKAHYSDRYGAKSKWTKCQACGKKHKWLQETKAKLETV